MKSAIAFPFQSATGDCLNLDLWRLWKNMRRKVQVLSQLHDAVYFQAPIPKDEDAELELLSEAASWIKVTQRHGPSGRSMTIPVECFGGYNWAHRYRMREDGSVEDWNPNGLVEIKLG